MFPPRAGGGAPFAGSRRRFLGPGHQRVGNSGSLSGLAIAGTFERVLLDVCVSCRVQQQQALMLYAT